MQIGDALLLAEGAVYTIAGFSKLLKVANRSTFKDRERRSISNP